MPTLHLFAGPNGSGKSTFAREVENGTRSVDYPIPRVINPDVIAQRLNPTNPDAAAASAAREALRQRSEALLNRESFSIETTLSGHSELRLIDDARKAGYTVTMTYIALDSPEANVDRVNLRAEEEVRTVPVEDVRRRYDRSLNNFSRIVDRFDAVYVVDNSGRSFADVATIEQGRVVTIADLVPTWVERALAPQLERVRDRIDVGREALTHLKAKTMLPQTVCERRIPTDGSINGDAIVVGKHHVAIATSGKVFAVVERSALDREINVGDNVRIVMQRACGIVQPIERAQECDRNR